MKLKELYKRAVSIGVANDPRGKETVLEELAATAKKYKGLDGDAKKYFDKDSLRNPYSDSRILHGTGDEEVECVMVGIDIDAGEVAVCDRLRQKGEKVDLILGHHPGGRALARLDQVMQMQAEILAGVGVPISTAESMLSTRRKDIERRLMPVNHTRTEDAARLLDIPLMCLHTPADNMVATFLQDLLDKEKPRLMSDVLDLLLTLPEYQHARAQGTGPNILLGAKDRKAGKTFVDMTGGTSGNKNIYESLANSGVDTIIGMHMGDDHRDKAKKYHMNVIIAGHISSDNIGMNLLLDGLDKKAGVPLMVYECSGFRRFPRD